MDERRPLEQHVGAFGEKIGTTVTFNGDGITRITYPDGTKVVPPVEWEPIETAPKDGSDVLLADARVAGGFQTVASYEIGDTLGMVWATNDGVSYNEGAFTHWMPLPSPPVSRGE